MKGEIYMPRKSINKLMYRDKQALTALSRCGYCTSNHLNNHVSDSRIKSYLRTGLISKETIVSNQNVKTTGYKLTGDGKKLLEKQFGVTGHYKAQSIPHDTKLADRYFSLSDSERESWRTETQLREEFYNKLEELREEQPNLYEQKLEELREGQISIPDCAYTTEQGIEIIYEVVTSNYGIEELDAKENAVEILKTEDSQYETGR